MEMEELVKILIAVVILLLLVGVFIFLFKGGGGDILESLKSIFRFGGGK